MEETLGKRIAANRKRLGITQDRLAEQLGVTAQAVSKWENDQSCPDITMLPRLAVIFCVSTDELLGIPPKPPAAEATVVEDQEPQGLHLQKGGWDFQWENSRRGQLGFALWVLLVGGLMLVSVIRGLEWGLWEVLWPSGLLILGVVGLTRRFSLFSLACGLFGGYFLADNLDLLPFALGKEFILPLFLLFFGLSLLLKAFRAPKHGRAQFRRHGKARETKNACTLDEDSFRCELAFEEDRRDICLPRLSWGSAEVAFGDLTVDLSGCEEFSADCFITAECAFGQLTILVPRSCRVIADHNETVLGSIDYAGAPDPEATDVLQLRASVSFGTITVRYI